MKSEIPGLYNGHVVDDRLLRSGEFLDFALAIPELRKLRVSRVLCLMSEESGEQARIDRERAAFDEARIEFYNIPLNSSGMFSWHDGERFVRLALDLVLDPKGLCVEGERCLVHCKHGSDRTGVVVACYRIESYRWPAEAAIEEMRKFGNAWYNFGMRRFVQEFADRQPKWAGEV